MGPRLENHAGTSSRSTAPTVSTAGAQPGAETVLFAEPLLPAAMTKRLGLCVASSCAADDIGSSQAAGAALLPRLMEMTSAPCATAHSMPPMIIESEPPPLSPRTLPMSSWVSGATPFLAPSLAAPEPPTVDAVWVPWPCTSDSAPPG